jgi:hypothetical protein
MKHLQPEHVLVGLRVYVYFNLHRKCFSVKALEGEHKGRVVHHTDSLHLVDATFKVSQKGRERVLRTKRKNVHAGVVGTFVTDSHWLSKLNRADPALCSHPVTYNPYKYSQFVDVGTLKPVHTAEAVYLRGRTITMWKSWYEPVVFEDIEANTPDQVLEYTTKGSLDCNPNLTTGD